jgi:peptidoglycan/LPS O-acetylase OafA/YrhL
MTNKRVNEIDLLRFLAALSVVFFHYSFRGYAADDMSVMPYPTLAPLAKYGYLGVELFFMISGFVILMTAAGGSLRGFVVSRFIRLYPAFWACCTITFAAIVLIGEPRYWASVNQYLINMTMLSGFVDVPAIDGVYWSLFVEMKFYALVAVVLVIRRIHQAHYFLIIWLFASVVLEILPISKLRYLLIVDHSAYFIAGAMFFLVWSQGFALTRVGAIIMSWGLAIFQSLKGLPDFEKVYNTNMNSYVVVWIVTLFFLVMFLVAIRLTGFFGRTRWLMAGALTYPLYLLHQRIGYMVFNIAYPRINPHLLLWGTIVVMLGLAYAVNILIEKKFSLLMKNAINHLFDSTQHLKLPTNGRS